MSIKLPIVNVKDINWNNHDSSFDIFNDIVVGDIAIIENKLECVLPLDDNEYCVTIDNGNVFIEEPFSYGKSYKYMISLLTDNCYGDYIYGRYIEGDWCPVGADFTYAIMFDNIEDVHNYAMEKAKLKLGEYAIHGFYI